MAAAHRPSPGSGRFALWVVSALALHAGLGSAVAVLVGGTARPGVVAHAVSERERSVGASELVEIEANEASQLEGRSATEKGLAGAPRVAALHVRGAARGSSAPVEATGATETEPETVAPAVAGAAPAARGQLSLEQLGVGLSNPLHGMSFDLVAPASAGEKLQASLRHDPIAADRRRHDGPEAAVVEAARQLALARDTLVDASAVLSVRADATGRVTNVDVAEASSAAGEWRWLAGDLLRRLAGTSLRLPGSNAGTELKLRITSAVRLPSGANPGLRLDLFGQTLKEGGGPRSTSLSLSPRPPLQQEQVFDNAGRHQDSPMKLAAGLLELRGDPADISATARRVVEVTVLSMVAASAP